jgi:putative ABC transport system permease protein
MKRDIPWLGFKGLKERKLRAILTILMVVVGVASIIALVSQTTGIQVSVIGSLQTLDPTAVAVFSVNSGLTQADVAKIGAVSNVATVIPIVIGSATIKEGGKTVEVTVVGVDAQGLPSLIGQTKLIQGATYSAGSAPFAVVGHNVAFPVLSGGTQSLHVGESLTLGQNVGGANRVIRMQVVGLLDKLGSGYYISPDDSIFLPLNSAEQILNTKVYGALIVKAVSVTQVDGVATTLHNIYGSNAQVQTSRQITSAVSTAVGGFGVLLGSVSIISLSVAGLGIMNMMYVSVLERTREIGILKSVGFKDRDVLLLFLSQAAIVGFLGWLIGVAAGVGTSSLIHAAFYNLIGGVSNGTLPSYTPIIGADLMLNSFLIAMAVSVGAGIYPAWRGSRMQPVKALRS